MLKEEVEVAVVVAVVVAEVEMAITTAAEEIKMLTATKRSPAQVVFPNILVVAKLEKMLRMRMGIGSTRLTTSAATFIELVNSLLIGALGKATVHSRQLLR